MSSQATASPSIMQERERSRESNDQREATGKIIARTAIEAHSRAVFPGNNPKAIVLDLMQPLAAGRQLPGLCRKARRNPTAGIAGCCARAASEQAAISRQIKHPLARHLLRALVGASIRCLSHKTCQQDRYKNKVEGNLQRDQIRSMARIVHRVADGPKHLK